MPRKLKKSLVYLIKGYYGLRGQSYIASVHLSFEAAQRALIAAQAMAEYRNNQLTIETARMTTRLADRVLSDAAVALCDRGLWVEPIYADVKEPVNPYSRSGIVCLRVTISRP